MNQDQAGAALSWREVLDLGTQISDGRSRDVDVFASSEPNTAGRNVPLSIRFIVPCLSGVIGCPLPHFFRFMTPPPAFQRTAFRDYLPTGGTANRPRS